MQLFLCVSSINFLPKFLRSTHDITTVLRYCQSYNLLTILKMRRFRTRPHFHFHRLGLFFQALTQYLNSGVPLQMCLLELIRASKHEQMRLALFEIEENIRVRGKSLSSALSQADHIFPPFVSSYIRFAEQTGNLAEMCQKLSDYMQWRHKIRQEWLKHKSYLMLVGSFLMTSLMSIFMFLVPVVKELFLESSQNIPWYTQGILWVADFFATIDIFATLLFVVAITIALRILLGYLSQGYKPFEDLLSRIKLSFLFSRIPLLYDFWFHLHQLLAASVSLQDALHRLRGDMPVLSSQIQHILNALMLGENIVDAFTRSKLLPHNFLIQWTHAEKTNDIIGASLQITNALQDEMKASIDKTLMLVQPLGLAMIATILVIIVLSLFIPLYSL